MSLQKNTGCLGRRMALLINPRKELRAYSSKKSGTLYPVCFFQGESSLAGRCGAGRVIPLHHEIYTKKEKNNPIQLMGNLFSAEGGKSKKKSHNPSKKSGELKGWAKILPKEGTVYSAPMGRRGGTREDGKETDTFKSSAGDCLYGGNT